MANAARARSGRRREDRDADALHQRDLRHDVGAHLAGTDQPDPHGTSLRRAFAQAFGDVHRFPPIHPPICVNFS